MKDLPGGCEVYLVGDGRVVTRFRMDQPPGMLADEINSGRRRYKRFERGVELKAVQRENLVFVCIKSLELDLERLLDKPRSSEAVGQGHKFDYLTERQRQVLSGLASGRTLAEIGYQLGIRVRSVRHHVDALKRRWGAVSLSQLVARALESGGLESTPPQGGTGAGRRSDHPH